MLSFCQHIIFVMFRLVIHYIDLLACCYLLLYNLLLKLLKLSFLLLDLFLLRLHRLVVLRHLHIRLLDLLLFHLLFVAFFNISLDAVIDGFDILLDIVEETNQFEMNFIKHDEADNQYFWKHIDDKSW